LKKTAGPSPEINHALAGTYYELTQYPWAILYYEKILKEDPQNKRLINKLNAAQAKLSLEFSNAEKPPYWRIALLDPFLAQSQRLQLFFWLALIALALGILTIWWPNFVVKKVFFVSLGLSLLILVNYYAVFYLSPIEGIVVSSSGLYREPDNKVSQLTPAPIAEGTKVRVIDASNHGFWLKIIDPDGQLGYLPSKAVRLI